MFLLLSKYTQWEQLLGVDKSNGSCAPSFDLG
jgi:hypothetical protein